MLAFDICFMTISYLKTSGGFKNYTYLSNFFFFFFILFFFIFMSTFYQAKMQDKHVPTPRCYGIQCHLKIKSDLQKLLDISFRAYKIKVIPIQQECMSAYVVQQHSFLTTTLQGGKWLASHASHFPTGKHPTPHPQYQLNKRLVGSWDSVHALEKSKIRCPSRE